MNKKYFFIVLFIFLNINACFGNNSNEESTKEIPEWLSNGIMYQIWLRSFTVEGTLIAATKKLPEIAELGATIVYLCPIMLQDRDINREFWSPRQQASPANNPLNPYRIADYTKIDPEYGTEEDFKTFVQVAHDIGLYVILDLVYRHTGPGNVLITQHPEFYKKDSLGNIYINQYNFPELNFDNLNLREFLLNNMINWMEEYKFDGWRYDSPHTIPLDFFKEARKQMEEINPDVGILLESNDPELFKACDVSYGSVWFAGLKKIFVNGDPATELKESWEILNNKFPSGAHFIRWIDNHDGFRPEIVFGEKASKAANVINFTIDGVPFIFQGQEIGDGSPYGIRYYPEKSYNDNGAINWNTQFIPHKKELINWYKELITLRKSENALQKGKTMWLKTDNPESAVAFLRKTDNETIIVVVNVSNRKIKVDVELQDLKNNKEIKPEALFVSNKDRIIRLNRQNVTLSLGSFGYYVGKLSF
jgi:cyclomaltodextrinase